MECVDGWRIHRARLYRRANEPRMERACRPWRSRTVQHDVNDVATQHKGPYKPDIVMEAGNMGRSPTGGDPDFLPELQLLTTNNEFTSGVAPFVDFHDTSAAAPLAATLATRLVALYPGFSPETVRGFMVHSARWTDAMKARAVDGQGRPDMERMLRTF